jgi:hypothetical protein
MNLRKTKLNQPCKFAFNLLLLALLALTRSASAQIVVTGSDQTGAVPFTPSWTPVTGGLLDNLAPTTATGNFAEYGTGGSANNLTTVGESVQIQSYSGAGNLEMCGSDGTAGSVLIYTLPAATYGQNITNITVYGGWQDNGRDQQFYVVFYSTVSAPGTFIPLTYVNYNPQIGGGIGSATQVIISDALGGPIAVNVAALEFVFNKYGVENGADGYTAITAQGTAATGFTNTHTAFTYATQNPAAGTPPTWTIETNSLIARQLPTATVSGNFANFGIGSPGLSALTDGTYGNVDAGSSYATCGGENGGCGQSVTYTLTNNTAGYGSDITNIVVWSGWGSSGRDGQFYHISYSTVYAPSTFIPITGVCYDPNSGVPISDRVSIYNSSGAPLATNVSQLKFDWTEQANFMANGGSLYAEIIVQGTNSAVGPPIAPSLTVNNFSFEDGGTFYYYNGVNDGAGTLPSAWSPFNPQGNWAGLGTSGDGFNAPDGNTYLAINTVPSSSGPSGVYQDVGALLPNTVYTLTVAVGRNNANGPAGVGNWSPGIISLLNGTDSTGALLATTTGYPSVAGTFLDYTATFSTGASPSGDLVITLSAAPANTYQATFDNVRLTSVVSPVPLPTLLTNITPSSATVAMGSNVVFTASFSNTPPVSLQWQQIASGPVTNNINTGVVTVTNSGVVTSTLTLTNVQLTNAGSYQLEAANATNFVTIVYTASAPLTVVPTITWYAPGAYNYTFTNDSVLALAGSVANEVYGVDFGGSGSLTTANNYSFNDYAGSGNMSVAGTVTTFGGYEGSATTGDNNFDTILNNGINGTSANIGTLNNLTVGQTYTVLVLLDDTRTSGAGGPNFDVTDGITTSPSQQFAFPNGAPAIGGYIMGTFTAASTNQPLTVLQDGNAQYIAILLETGIAAPPTNAPELTADLTPPVLEVTTGGPVNFQIGAGGTLPLNYQWFNQGGQIGGATTSSYSFNAVAGTNSYYVVITNSYGSVTSSIVAVISVTNIVTVNNFSFEAQVTAPGTDIGFNAPNGPTGWTGFNVGSGGNYDIGIEDAGGSDYTVFDPLAATADGNNFLWINRFNGNGTQVAGVYQDVGTLLPNTTYTLTVAIGDRNDAAPNSQPTWSPGIIALLNGTDYTGTVLATGGGLPATANTWQNYTVTYTTGASVSGDLTVELSALDAPSIQADFDNVELTRVSVAPTVPPVLNRTAFSGGNLILTGTGGTANADYTWLTTTNLSAPIIWTTNSTGTLDGTGSFSNAIPVNTSQGAAFFRLRLP